MYEMSSKSLKNRHYGFQASKDGGVQNTRESSVFSVMAGWITEVLFMLFYSLGRVETVQLESGHRVDGSVEVKSPKRQFRYPNRQFGQGQVNQ